MLKELLTYFTTPCPKHIRHMGYLYEAIAMRERYRRNKASWHHHLEKSKKFILSASGKIKNRQKIIIIGSGLLLDVPLKKLSLLFREVILADIIHLPETRRVAKKYNNVSLLEYDTTNTAEALFLNIKNGIMDFPASKPTLPDAFIDNDAESILVVSLNILSQLSVIPHLYTIKNMPDADESKIENWCRGIIESHISWLFSLPCNVCMISDHEFIRKNKNGDISEKGSTIHGVVLPEYEDSWIWKIAPHGEESGEESKELYVGAWSLKKTDS
ncbi:hypothetical protein [Desulforegula conservatrix]|uniref:hypothetical protein n=1 Tax=Desulforegula conservatrix TaxID=153026 RepID=UPI0012EC2DCA|nr:hypothetical protein [Desulforegula conservatrix]